MFNNKTMQNEEKKGFFKEKIRRKSWKNVSREKTKKKTKQKEKKDKLAAKFLLLKGVFRCF